jgi:DNA-binding GntR family transcriptional regulator
LPIVTGAFVEDVSMMPAHNASAATPGYVSKTDMVAALIRELIITGGLPAGERLRQRELAQQFAVSQTPVREAMRRLESEGLVIGDTHRGFTVGEADVGPVAENYQIRVVLESLAASLAAAKIDGAGIGRLRQLNDQIRVLPEGDPRFRELNRTFHFAVYEHARSPLLMSLMRLLWAALRGTRRVPQTYAQSVQQHDDLLEALSRNDSAAAAAQTYFHIMGVEQGQQQAP